MYKKQAEGQKKAATSGPAPSAGRRATQAGSTQRFCVTCRAINESPLQAAQAKKIAQLFPAPIQRQPVEDEDLLQGKFPAQRQPVEDEDLLQGKFPAQRQEEGEPVQAAAGNNSANAAGSPARSSGIPGGLQTKMESAFNTDLSGVTVHPNSQKATEVGALAYTQGSDIHLAPGQYNPSTSTGKKLLGHEMAHVVQQAEGRVQPTGEVAGLPLNDSPTLEKEADNLAAKL